ncbi:UDP-N-acetylmuramate--L-alanine ligase [Bryobacter aggregatus]|uniref:UDP-N-acetylmuramate--L-alanine ligase n=1 Tax=Bryobacter aggregatus TaxID=360054 RepID=UPI0004E27286|nr:UDP-N-acetylmuramate--L-alanine ligase [Bryobacter aggregatus]
MFFRKQHFHFTGIGGIGMSGIAEVLLTLGNQVSGSDLKSTPITQRLAERGARIFVGHAANNIGEDVTALVVTSAVDESNAEIQEARHRKIPVIPRGELLAELMRLKYGIAIGGSHGKTTTTSMTATILSTGGLDPTVVVGGRVSTMGGSNARVGQSDLLVVESDESDGSFLKLAPIMAVVTNIDREHLDFYKTFERVLASFTDFVNRVPFYGVAIVCIDDENVRRMLPDVKRRVITYGTTPQADLVIRNVEPGKTLTSFELQWRGDALGRFEVQVPGAHNVLNATAAIAVSIELGLDVSKIAEGLAAFRGVDRRFQFKGEVAGVTVIDDYGHHPTEVRATLSAARQRQFSKIHVLFQPHRYTRTQILMDDFAGSFFDADSVTVLPIYAASEEAIAGVSSETLVEKMRGQGQRDVEYSPSLEAAARSLAAKAKSGEMILTLGAGTVSQAGEMILAELSK